MNFDLLDEKMRVYETANDYCVLPGIYMVARIDGRNFTRLTKELHNFEAPFDIKFRDYMVETTEHLMNCGFRIIYGYTQSDEISLLFHLEDNTFNRKMRKLNSVLAGEASAKFTSLLGDIGSFDCRISQLPSIEKVQDYFLWRLEDAHRNALNAHCYWALRKDGKSVSEATNFLIGKSVSEKNEILFNYGINFNNLPNWHKRGTGLYWAYCEKEGFNPVTNKTVKAKRRIIEREFNLPISIDYAEFIRNIISSNNQ
jgi:tRNA(His) 5'-end guanylyltransferase